MAPTGPTTAPPLARRLTLEEARGVLVEGDVLLYRGTGVVSRWISSWGRGEYSHAAVATRIHGDWFVAEVREWVGGRIVSLADQVRRYPGQIDIYRARDWQGNDSLSVFRRHNVTKYMRLRGGCDYGYAAVLRAAIVHLPLAQLLIKLLPILVPKAFWNCQLLWLCQYVRRRYERKLAHDTRREAWPYCSMLVDAAYFAAGADVVPNLDGWLTEPSDLARSYFFTQVGTIE